MFNKSKLTYQKQLIFLFGFLSCLTLWAQRPEADSFTVNGKALTIQPVLHGTLVMEYNGKVIYIDPYGGGKAFEGLKKPDLILITDIHGDHLNEKTLDELGIEGVSTVVPQAVADQISEKYKNQLVILSNGEKKSILGIDVLAIPMYNLPESDDAKHIKGRGNGYLLSMEGKNIYISGDTEDIPEMRSLKNIDVAFVCMNLPYTMDIKQAASAVLDFKPKIVYPYHYRGRPEISDTEAFRKLVNDENDAIEVRLRNWYPEYE